MRTTTITITSVFDDYPELLTKRLQLCQVDRAAWVLEYRSALDYLVRCGLHTCEKITIHTDAYGEMTACYYELQEQPRPCFVQGAVPRWSNLPGKPFEFTFHS